MDEKNEINFDFLKLTNVFQFASKASNFYSKS